jgi:acid phosphatase
MAKASDDLAIPLLHLHSQNNSAQLAWLEAALKASTAPWKIVIAHHPVYSGGQHGDTPYIIKNILPLLEKYGVQVWFNGHDHDLQHLQAGKVNLFCSGAGSKPRAKMKSTPHTKFALGCSGFIAAALQADQLNLRMIDDQGKLLYTTSVPRNTG